MPIVRTFLLLRFVFDSSSGAPQRASLVWFTNLQPLVGFLLLQPSVGHLSFIHDIQPSVEKERWRRRNRFVNQTMTSKREVKGDVRRLVFNQSCSSNTNRLVSFMVWITNLLLLPFSFSPFIQPSVGHFGNLISSHEVLPKCMKGEERKGKDSWLIPTVDWSSDDQTSQGQVTD